MKFTPDAKSNPTTTLHCSTITYFATNTPPDSCFSLSIRYRDHDGHEHHHALHFDHSDLADMLTAAIVQRPNRNGGNQ